MEKNDHAVEVDRQHRLQVAVARETAANHAIELALDNDAYMELAEMYDSLALALCEYETDLEQGVVYKPVIP